MRLSLERDEADYLSDRIRASVGESLFNWLLDHLRERSTATFIWEHELASSLPARLRRQVQHARAFSEVMAGASILYNGLVCEGPPRLADSFDEMEAKFGEWFEEFGARYGDGEPWDRADFWRVVAESGARPTGGAQAFANRWVELATAASSAPALWSSQEARTLIPQPRVGSQAVPGQAAQPARQGQVERVHGADSDGLPLGERPGRAQ